MLMTENKANVLHVSLSKQYALIHADQYEQNKHKLHNQFAGIIRRERFGFTAIHPIHGEEWIADFKPDRAIRWIIAMDCFYGLPNHGGIRLIIVDPPKK